MLSALQPRTFAGADLQTLQPMGASPVSTPDRDLLKLSNGQVIEPTPSYGRGVSKDVSMNGIGLEGRLKQFRPNLHVILVTASHATCRGALSRLVPVRGKSVNCSISRSGRKVLVPDLEAQDSVATLDHAPPFRGDPVN